MDKKAVKQLSGLTLAYLGDAAWEIQVRTHLVASGLTRPHDLHERATHFVSAKAQAKLVKYLLDSQALTETEISIFKRGRNSQSHSSAKNADIHSYRLATGLEALMGYLYLVGTDRFQALSQVSIAYLEEDKDES